MDVIAEINRRLFETIETWLPNTKRTAQGVQACNPIRGDQNPESMMIYPNGRGKDFAADQALDCINLYAAQNNLQNGDAIKYLSDKFGLSTSKTLPKRIEGAVSGRKVKLSVVQNNAVNEFVYPPEPYPANAFTHYKYGPPSVVYTYFDIHNKLIGYTCRFDFKDGNKAVLPFTWSNTSGKYGWHWNADAWKNDWPIYGIEKLAQMPNATVIIGEGEKVCDYAQRLLPDCVVLGVGGTGKVKKVKWDFLKGRTVLIWPDADQKFDKKTGELLPPHEQPGMKAAIQIAQLLESEKPKIIIPPKGVTDGWDLADAAEEGWTASKVFDYITRSSFTEDELEKELGVSWKKKKDTYDDYIQNLPKHSIPDDLESRFFPLVVVEEFLNEKGEPKKKVNVPSTIKNYLKVHIEENFKEFDEFIISEKEMEESKQKLSRAKRRERAVKAKRAIKTKSLKHIKNIIWCDCNQKIRNGATKEEIENHFFNILDQKRDEALKILQEKTTYDGTTFDDALRITSIWIAHAISKDDVLTDEFIKLCEVQAKVLLHFIWQVKSKMHYHQVKMHMMPILIGVQGNGKSEFVRNLCKVLTIPYGGYVRDVYMDEIGQEKNEIILAQTLINILDEMAGIAKSDLSKYKNFASRYTVNPRGFATQMALGEIFNQSTQIGCANVTNLNEIVHDDSGNRRFFPIHVHGMKRRKLAYRGEGTDLMLEKLDFIEEDNVFPYEFDAIALWKMVDHDWDCFVEDDSIAAVQLEHRYEPLKQFLENISAQIINEDEYKSLVRKSDMPDDCKLVSIGLLLEIFKTMTKMNNTELKRWNVQKFGLEMKKLGAIPWICNDRALFYKSKVCGLIADWSQIETRMRLPWNTQI